MNISILGTGNVASVIAKLCAQNGHTIIQVIGRNEEKGKSLANTLQAEYINFKGVLNKSIDICIVAIADNAFPEGLHELNFGNKLVVHTAGSISMSMLQNVSTNFGVLYPLQSLRKELTTFPPIPFLLEANNEGSLNILHAFATTLSDTVYMVEEQKRFRLHAAAVIVSNFTNHLYSIANTYCNNEAVDFNLLKPLILETASRIENAAPITLQTGPAIRKDITTLEKHLQLFGKYPKVKTLYTRMTDSIMND